MLVRGKECAHLRTHVGTQGVEPRAHLAPDGIDVATLAFEGDALAEAKVGLLSTLVIASAVTWTVFRLAKLLSPAIERLCQSRHVAGERVKNSHRLL